MLVSILWLKMQNINIVNKEIIIKNYVYLKEKIPCQTARTLYLWTFLVINLQVLYYNGIEAVKKGFLLRRAGNTF